MLLEVVCALCDRPGDVVCAPCAAALRPAPSLAVPLELDGCSALFDYDGARRLVTALKNGGRRDLVGWLAARIAAAEPPPGAVLTWAPTGTSRRQARGFDQAELLARAVARRWWVPCRALLRRRPGPAQAGLSAGERRRNPVFASRRACPPTVVLLDDVATTGATLTAAARTLRAAGATSVRAIVAARAPAGRAG